MNKNENSICFGLDGCCGGWICAFIYNNQNQLDFFNNYFQNNILDLNKFNKSEKEIIFFNVYSINEFWNLLKNALKLNENFQEINRLESLDLRIFIDIPIGLPDSQNNIRICDKYARIRLTRKRSSSIFSVPCREAVYAENFEIANQINKKIIKKGLSRQCWNICSKIKEVDEFLTQNPDLIDILIESHPELCFWALNGGSALQHYKKHPIGIFERINILKKYVSNIDEQIQIYFLKLRNSNIKSKLDDLIDAAVLAISAYLSPKQYIKDFSKKFTIDKKNFPMRIVHSPI